MAKKRELWIDIVKIYACILVTLGHFFPGLTGSGIIQHSTFSRWFVDTVYMFHVPLFFICSGYVYQKFTVETSFKDCVENRLKKLITLGVPYFVFSIATWLIKFVFSNMVDNKLGGLFTTLFLEPASPYWYLYSLFFLFLITPVLRGKKNIAILFVALLLKSITFFSIEIDVYFVSKILENEIWFAIGVFLCSFNLQDRLMGRWKLVCGVLLGALFIVGSIYYCLNSEIQYELTKFILGVIACISTLIVAINIQQSGFFAKIAKLLSVYTFPVFLMHTMFAASLRSVLIKLNVHSVPIHIVFGLIFAFVGPVIVAWIMSKIKYIDFLLYPGKYIKFRKKPKGENNG